MAKIRKEYTTNPEFDPTKVAKASSAAEGLCKWVLAMEIYDRVVKVVAPKKIKLAQAEADLAATMEKLNKKRAELKEIEERLASLQQTFQNMVDEKNKLEAQVNCAGFKPGAGSYVLQPLSLRLSKTVFPRYLQCLRMDFAPLLQIVQR